MPDTNIAFANIVPNTAPASWSQAYNAGKLFAVVSLKKEVVEGQEISESELNTLGKEVISTFEQEFFTLENKNLDTIKNAISIAIQKIKNLPEFSFVITYISGSVLYVFIAGSGNVILKRGSKLGTILESEADGEEVKSGSGFLQNDDLIVLETSNFSKLISVSTLAEAMDGNNPSGISEILAPKIHEKANGAAAASILMYKDDKATETLSHIAPDLTSEEDFKNLSSNLEGKTPDNFSEISLDNLTTPKESEPPVVPETKPSEEKPEELIPAPPLSELVMNAEEEEEEQTLSQSIEKKKRIRLSFPHFGLSGLNHRRRLLLSIALLIIIVLGVSIFLGIKNNNDKKIKEEFAQIYPQAEQKYKEGKSLEDLNASLAQDDYKAAQQILEPNKDKFKSGSAEDKQIESLLSQVNDALGKAATANNANAKEIASSSSGLLSVEINNPSVSYFTQDTKNVYFLDGAGIQSVNKATSKKTQIVKKSWKDAGGIGEFLGNVYVLDKSSDQIFKFASGSFAKSNYLGASTSASFTDVSSIGIDGAIYVLSKDGSIQKFLKGNVSNFAITGLFNPLSNPTKIATDGDFNNIYVLDNSNSRIVVLDKNGKYQTEYSNTIIKNAKDFEILEKDKKIYVLSNGKVYEIDLK